MQLQVPIKVKEAKKKDSQMSCLAESHNGSDEYKCDKQ